MWWRTLRCGPIWRGNISSTRWRACTWRPLSGTSSSDEMGLLSECFPPNTDCKPDRQFVRDLRPLAQRRVFRKAVPLSVLEIVAVATSHELEFMCPDISTEIAPFPALRRQRSWRKRPPLTFIIVGRCR